VTTRPSPPPPPPPRRPGPTPHRQRLGRLGEDFALAHFERLGFTLVDRNYRTRWGELDLIVADATTLVFAEVKTARHGAGVAPHERLHAAKRTQVRRIARDWLYERDERPRRSSLRFDAVCVVLDARGRLLSLEHFEAAF
jgi:putative endonuclease